MLHCAVSIVGRDAKGRLLTSPVVCGEAATAARLSAVAVHYADFDFGGATLSLDGGSCNGGWLDLPAAWVNRISSTWSGCTMTHFDLFGLGAAQQSLPAGGGNLGPLHDKANSVRYT